MYHHLLVVHSLFRWLVLISLLLSIIVAADGYFSRRQFSKTTNQLRHWTATIAHLQLTLGAVLYFISPISTYFYQNLDQAFTSSDRLFFDLLHPLLMFVAIVVLTIGSATAKRKKDSLQQYKTMLIWYSAAFILIVIAIPWPFSPLAERSIFRAF